MTKSVQKFFSKIAAFSLLASVASPALAADSNLMLTGNGAFSANNVDVEMTHDTTVVQSNTADVSNYITADSSTGGNDASFNTGGDVTVWTGDASTSVEVNNLLNKNVASVGCCELGDLDVLVSGNGAYADTSVGFTVDNSTELFQENDADVTNRVDAGSTTGANGTSFNTGGDTVVKTGTAVTDVMLTTAANANTATVGGGTGSGSGDVSLRLFGNGAFSDNDVDVDLDRQTVLVQSNYADVYNRVDADAKTGWNDSGYNTGGETAILSGNAGALVSVDNFLNFNAADVDCDCLVSDLLTKVDGNGAYSDSRVDADLTDSLSVFQDGNEAWLTNKVDGNAKTGANSTAFSTGDVDGDPFIHTGRSVSDVMVTNASNMNVYGTGAWEMPTLEWDWDMNWLHL
jgi:hypothetical protein